MLTHVAGMHSFLLSSYSIVWIPQFIFPSHYWWQLVFLLNFGSYSLLHFNIWYSTLPLYHTAYSLSLIQKILLVITDQNTSSESQLNNWKCGRDSGNNTCCEHSQLRKCGTDRSERGWGTTTQWLQATKSAALALPAWECVHSHSLVLLLYPFLRRVFQNQQHYKDSTELNSFKQVCRSCCHSECAYRCYLWMMFLETAWVVQLSFGERGHHTQAHKDFGGRCRETGN